MKPEKPRLINIIDHLCRNEEIDLAAIPDMELYMDQLLSFLNARLAPFKRGPEDKGLTKTMINNYSKNQILIPPRNKKYTREHILLLILVYQLKNILTIGDIKRLFRPILKDISTSEDDVIPLDEIYETFLALEKQQFSDFCTGLAAKAAYIEDKTAAIVAGENRQSAELFLVVLMLVAQANASKRLAEQIIDACFAPGEDDEAEQPAPKTP